MNEAIERLQAEILNYPQVEVPTFHHMHGGLYIREGRMKPDTTIVGKVHKHDHFIVVLSGEVSVSDETGSLRYVGPVVVACNAGTKRALYSHTDVVWLNIHRTDETELEAVENDLVEPDASSPFLPGNRLPALEQQ